MGKIALNLLILILCFSAANSGSTGETKNAPGTLPSHNYGIEAGQTAGEKAAPKDNIIVGYADLTHDGVKEKIVVDISNIEKTQNAVLKIVDSENRSIWEEAAGIPHVGWNSLYLYTKDGKDYLLRYNPYMNQGMASYRYELFWIDEMGIEKNVSSDRLDFDTTIHGYPLDIAGMLSFADKINAYLSQSTLLLSTEGGKLTYSTETNKVVRTEQFSWLYDGDIKYDESDTLKERLEKYQKYLEEQFKE